MSESKIPPEESGLSPAGDTSAPAPAGQDGKDAKPPKKPGSDGFAWLQALTLALVILVVVFTFFGRIIGVDGHSMDSTLADNDLLLLQCVAYTPKQGDIVVLHKDFGEITSPVVKRVIAVGGQTVEIDYSTSTVYVDGQPLDEPYINEPMVQPGSAYMQQTYWEVPEGSVFVMGDNRNASSDSRDERLGCIDEGYILGRAVCVLLPFGHTQMID